MGRRRELALLEELWPEVERGSRQVLFIGGDPGSGKSRLAAEAAMALHRHDVSVLVGTCSSDVGLPFDPLVEPVRALLPQHSPRVFSEKPGVLSVLDRFARGRLFSSCKLFFGLVIINAAIVNSVMKEGVTIF